MSFPSGKEMSFPSFQPSRISTEIEQTEKPRNLDSYAKIGRCFNPPTIPASCNNTPIFSSEKIGTDKDVFPLVSAFPNLY